MQRICKPLYDVERYSEEFWEIQKNYAKQLYIERQTMINFEINEVLYENASLNSDNEIVYDYSVLDKFIEIYMQYLKPQKICGMHLFWRDYVLDPMPNNGWNQRGLVTEILTVEDGKISKKTVSASDQQTMNFYEDYLKKLYDHLCEKGWNKYWVQHVADEIDSPIQYQQAIEYYKMIHRIMPEAKTMDAVRKEASTYFGTELDYHVPISYMYDESYRTYDKVNNGENQVWQYTCLQPQYDYMGRLGDYKLICNRLLHWYSFKHGLCGYLHYAWNRWYNLAPTTDATCYGSFPCDSWIVYPDKENLSVYWSIRGICNVEGIIDYEIMLEASKKNKKLTDSTVSLLVTSANSFVYNTEMLKNARKELLKIASGEN